MRGIILRKELFYNRGKFGSRFKVMPSEIRRLYSLGRHALGFPKGTLTFFIVKLLVVLIPLVYTIKNWKYGIWLLLGYLGLLLISRKEEFSPKQVKLVRDGYKGRKAQFAAAISEIAKGVDFGKVDKRMVRQYALDMIVSYTRGYHNDGEKAKIFSCLMVKENGGKSIRVLLRGEDSARQGKSGTVYPTEGMFAAKCFALRDIVYVGDIKAEYADTPVGKKYNSVLCLPILGPEPDHSIYAVVSIDSTEYYHFDRCASDLQTALLPYLALIELTFRNNSDIDNIK